ncbi:alpha/beta hydrolase family protein [Kitasatospora griseola]|uniref:alpha/beta hydrolase family protein n=1 Tax=Kitasatospora griseola TaxID=2064 RepID=UPI0036D9FA4A
MTTALRRAAAAAAALLALPLAVTAAAPAPAAPAVPLPLPVSASTAVPADVHLQLPRPTGPYAVGREILHLVDRGRPDPWVPSAGPRQLMVSMHYPAERGTGGAAPYMTPAAARLLLDDKLPEFGVPTEALAGARTWARTGAQPLQRRFPLLVLSPGFTMPRTELTNLAEDLTSRGYVVALIDHTYENTGTTFPDGRTLTCILCDTLTPDSDWAGIVANRAKDASFVVDQLTTRPRYAHLVDRDRIGMAGHSSGGAATVPALLTDSRIRAGVDLDGSLDHQVPVTGLKGKPFMVIGNSADGQEDPSWTAGWPRVDGWKRWLTVAGSDHSTFTDYALFFEQLGLPPRPGATIDAARGLRLTRQYVAAFFDLHLKGVPQPILDGPTPQNPEITFHP